MLRLGLLVVICLAGCASGSGARRHLTALVFAAEDRRIEIESAVLRAEADAEIDVAVLPALAPLGLDEGSGEIDDRLAHARQAYEEGDYERCAEALSDEDLVERAIDAADRASAARVLWWRAACARASSGPEAAAPFLDAMALLDLSRPGSDVEAVAASLDVQLADRRAEIAASARATLSLEVAIDARVRIDGAEFACAGTCRANLPAGRHHVHVSAPGRVSRSTWTEVREASSLTIALEDASPEAAAREWQAHYSRAGDRESQASLDLLRRLLGTEHLVLLLADGDEVQDAPFQLAGLYADDEGIDARATRDEVRPPFDGAVTSMLFELVPWARPEPWWESPWPWIVLGAVVAAVASGVTYYYAAPITGPSVVRLRVMP